MIVRLPYQLPDPDPKKSYCLILGSALDGTFAREIERSFDSVCLAGDLITGGPEYLEHVVHELGTRAAVIVAWLAFGPGGLEQPGLGSFRWVVELAELIATRPEALVIGAEPGCLWFWPGCLLWHLGQRGFPTYDNTADLLTAARHRARLERKPR